MNRIVFYHKNCNDGFGAAFSAWRKFGSDASYVPIGAARDEAPSTDSFDEAYFLDVTPNNLRDLAPNYGHVYVVDHHKTGMETWKVLQGGPSHVHHENISLYFDASHSAAVLSWIFFHPYEPIPPLLTHLEDYDLWRFEHEGSHRINAAIRSFPFEFGRWNLWVIGWEEHFAKLLSIGETVLRTEEIYWRRAMDRIQWIHLTDPNIQDVKYPVPVVNTEIGHSEVSHELLKRYGGPMAGYYFDRGDGYRQWGLRSDGRVDLTKIVAKFGGGGHAKAAGFKTNIDNPLSSWSPEQK